MHAVRYRRHLALVLGIVLLPAAGARAWRADVSAPLDSVFTVAVDGAGDVIAVGSQPDGFLRDATVAKFDGASGAELWRVTFDGTDPFSDDDFAGSVVLSVADDVFVAGNLENAVTGEDLFVVKLAGATGAELWRVDMGGTASVRDYGGFLAVLGGDVVLSGTLDNGSTEGTVVRLAGATGAELWRYEVTGTAGSGAAGGVHVDGAGDVLVGLALTNTGSGVDAGAAKLAGATGVEVWRYELPGPLAMDSDFPAGSTVDAAGDVILLSEIGAQQYDDAVTVTKVDGGTGAELWRTSVPGGACGAFEFASDITVDASGDPIAVAVLDDASPACDQVFSVLKFDGATGTQLWWREVEDSGPESFGIELAVDTAGDVVAVGVNSKQSAPVVGLQTAVKLGGTTGDERWRQVLGPGGFAAVALDSQGDAVVGGQGVFKLSGLSGAVGPVAGRRLGVKDAAGQPQRRSLRALLVDDAIATAPPGSAGDPRTSGAVLTLVNPTTLESASFTLPAAGWTGLGTPSGARGYRYVDGGGAYGPCRRVTLKPSRMSAQCSGRSGPIPFDLDEPSQGALTVSLVITPTDAHCATFGGDVRKDAGTANPGPAGSFSALDAPPAVGSCP